MNITIRQLQIFVAVVRGRSFAEASSNLHLSQPAISLAIKKLEDTLGGKLLMRSTRAVIPTPEGDAFYAASTQLLTDWGSVLENAQSLFKLQRGHLLIGAMPTFAGTLLPSILADFHSQYPGVDISVEDSVAEQLVKQVLHGRIELGISFAPGNIEDIKFEPLFFDHFVAVLPPQHPLTKRKKLALKDLEGSSFITLQRPSSIREQVMTTLAKHGVSLTPSFEAHQLTVVGRMVSTGLGVSIVPEISAIQMHEMGAECRPILPVTGREIGIITHRQRPLSAPSQAMMGVLHRWKQKRP